MEKAYVIMIVVSLLWCGFMSAISFMESWLKFKAPGLESSIGLSVGRKVFGGLNRVEWVFALMIWLSYATFRLYVPVWMTGVYLLLTLFLICQSFWLLPLMNKRVEARLRGEKLAPSSYHFWYVGMEIIKLFALLFISFSLLRLA